jgi:FAD/FMN-containing dehydrogenase
MSIQCSPDLPQNCLKLSPIPARVLTAPAVLDRLSHDFYWYSPVLRPKLCRQNGDVVVQPVSVDEVLRCCATPAERGVPVTVRGAGTGNYGQCVPLDGGIVLDLSLMDKLEEITAEGVAVCQPGLRLGVLETEARKQGWELRMYPSTLVKASLGGFLGGGSGGIGSVNARRPARLRQRARLRSGHHGRPEPRVVLHKGEAVHEILHAWGTNGVLTRIWFALAPAVDWTQVTAAFDTYEQAFRFTQSSRVDDPMDQAPGHRLRVAHPLILHAGQAVVREGKARAHHDCNRPGRSPALPREAGRRRGHLSGALHGPAHAARCSAITPGTTPRSGP